VWIFHAGTENIIHTNEVDKLDQDSVKVWLLLGLSREQVKEIVGFLINKKVI